MIAQSLRFLPALLLTIPMCLFVLLSAPAWLCWPFLSEQKHRMVVGGIAGILQPLSASMPH